MAAYITLANFTEQGARNIKDSPERFDAFKSQAEAAGITIKSVHWTSGLYDMVPPSAGNQRVAFLLLSWRRGKTQGRHES